MIAVSDELRAQAPSDLLAIDVELVLAEHQLVAGRDQACAEGLLDAVVALGPHGLLAPGTRRRRRGLGVWSAEVLGGEGREVVGVVVEDDDAEFAGGSVADVACHRRKTLSGRPDGVRTRVRGR